MSFKKLDKTYGMYKRQLSLSNATYNKNLELEKRVAKIRK